MVEVVGGNEALVGIERDVHHGAFRVLVGDCHAATAGFRVHGVQEVVADLDRGVFAVDDFDFAILDHIGTDHVRSDYVGHCIYVGFGMANSQWHRAPESGPAVQETTSCAYFPPGFDAAAGQP